MVILQDIKHRNKTMNRTGQYKATTMRKPKKDTLYKFLQVKAEGGSKLWAFRVFKLDEDYDQLGEYHVSQVSESSWVCTCPSWKSPCKHEKVARRIVALPALDECNPNSLQGSWLYSLNQDKIIPRAAPTSEE